MAVLVQRFTVVVVACRLAQTPEELAEVARSLDGISWCADGELLAVHYLDRHGFRRGLEELLARGFEDAAEILAATELSSRMFTPEELAGRLERIASTREVAVVHPRKERVPEWLRLVRGPAPGGGPTLSGCFLTGGESSELSVPEGWSLEHRVRWRDEPEDGDEALMTWHEFLAETSSPEVRDSLLPSGPEAVLAYARAVGFGKPFAGVVRPSPNVLEQEVTERDADGAERTWICRWVKL